MEKLKELLKEAFELFVQKRWLEEIDIELKKYKKFNDKARRAHYVMRALIKSYNERYPDSKLQVEYTDPDSAKWQFWEGWMSNSDMRIDDATCSNCGYKHPTVRRTYGAKETEQEVLSKLFKFCPNCGKPMDKNNN